MGAKCKVIKMRVLSFFWPRIAYLENMQNDTCQIAYLANMQNDTRQNAYLVKYAQMTLNMQTDICAKCIII